MADKAEDFDKGVAIDRLPDGGMLQGKVDGEDVILVRRGCEFFAVGASCTHYGGPLVKGLMVGDELRCPLHHACFSLRTGEAMRAPAFDPIPCWRVERLEQKVFVREKLPGVVRKPASAPARQPTAPASIVIVGAGGAALAAADMLRREGYDGALTMITADDSAPYDRPNLSKDYLEGKAPEEWMPLRSASYYGDHRIDLVLKSQVSSLDLLGKRVLVDDSKAYDFDALLLATGSEPVKLRIPGSSESQLGYLRTLADSRGLIEKAASAKEVLLVGASFIALEVAASLRERGIKTHIVAPDREPLEHVLGPDVGRFVRSLHENHGVIFHLGQTVSRLDGHRATLSSGANVDADFLVLGVGVRPSAGLAEKAGLKVDRGIVVNEYLETSMPQVFAAGDVARWPDARSGGLVRIEHWVVAERQGQVAARNMLGRRERFDAVPYFWTQQYDVAIKYVGHAEEWDTIDIDGSLDARDCALTYKLDGRTLAVATISRDLQSLQAEADFEAK
jgi:NADPH-dependent 2,4-dienoyl-CoA reductase/sulfur reductase-like enzyme/nitrite reductase/ring-hydroxylating ferredoxin subunit